MWASIYGRTIIPCCKHCTFVYATSVDKQLVDCNDISDGLRTEHVANMQAASIMFMLSSSQAGRGVVKVSSSHACCSDHIGSPKCSLRSSQKG